MMPSRFERIRGIKTDPPSHESARPPLLFHFQSSPQIFALSHSHHGAPETLRALLPVRRKQKILNLRQEQPKLLDSPLRRTARDPRTWSKRRNGRKETAKHAVRRQIRASVPSRDSIFQACATDSRIIRPGRPLSHHGRFYLSTPAQP